MQGAVCSWKGTGGGQAAAQGTIPARIQPRGSPSSVIQMTASFLRRLSRCCGEPHSCLPVLAAITHLVPHAAPPTPHLHTKPQTGLQEKKKIRTFPQPHSKMPSVSVLRKKESWRKHDSWQADKQLSGGMLVSHGVEICLYVVEKTRIEGASWDQPVKFHYSPKPIWKSLKNPGSFSSSLVQGSGCPQVCWPTQEIRNNDY